MKKSRIILVIAALCALWSCEKEIEYKGDDEESRLVINQVISKDSTFKVEIQRSLFFLESNSGNVVINDANIVLMNKTTGTIETQSSGSSGVYQFGMVAEQGHSYSIQVTHPNFPTAHSETVIPVEIPLISVDTSSVFNANSGAQEMTATLKWNDPVGENRYIVVVNGIYNGFNPAGKFWLESNDPSIVNGGSGIDGDPASSYFFALDDALFDGTEKEFRLEFELIPPGQMDELHFELYHCTEDAYRYLISAALNMDSGGGPFTEPVKLHTNVVDGYGIFAGINRSRIVKVL